MNEKINVWIDKNEVIEWLGVGMCIFIMCLVMYCIYFIFCLVI